MAAALLHVRREGRSVVVGQRNVHAAEGVARAAGDHSPDEGDALGPDAEVADLSARLVSAHALGAYFRQQRLHPRQQALFAQRDARPGFVHAQLRHNGVALKLKQDKGVDHFAPTAADRREKRAALVRKRLPLTPLEHRAHVLVDVDVQSMPVLVFELRAHHRAVVSVVFNAHKVLDLSDVVSAVGRSRDRDVPCLDGVGREVEVRDQPLHERQLLRRQVRQVPDHQSLELERLRPSERPKIGLEDLLHGAGISVYPLATAQLIPMFP